MTDTDLVAVPPMDHPAKWSQAVLDQVAEYVQAEAEAQDRRLRVLDPFAGVGRQRLEDAIGLASAVEVVGIELQPEWGDDQTIQGDARDLPADWSGRFDVLATSPAYGNRMADHHDAKDDSRRNTYRHALGRPLHPNNTGQMQWGEQYKAVHVKAWAEAVRVLRRGGVFVLNCSDHIRKGKRVWVTDWHVKALTAAGLEPKVWTMVPTPRQRFGANGDARVDGEDVVVLVKP